MTRKKNNFSTDYIIRNIEDQARQRNLTDGVTQAPLWFNNPPPFIRGSDRNAGSFVGKGPKKFVYPGDNPPEFASLMVWYDVTRRGASDEPLNYGSLGSALDMTTINGTAGITSGDDATLGHPLWESKASADYFRNDLSLGNNRLLNDGDDGTFAALITPGTRGALSRHEFFNNGDAGDGVGTTTSGQMDVLFDVTGQLWQWQFCAHRTALFNTLSTTVYLVIGYLENVSSAMALIDNWIIPLTGDTWLQGSDIGTTDGRMTQKMQMFSNASICNSRIAHVMWWNTGASGGLVDKDQIHTYFKNLYGIS